MILAVTHARPRARLLAAAVALVCTCATARAAGGDTVYTVANYPVEASAKNAVAAKDKALADGQSAALRSLLKRIVPVTAYRQLSNLKGVEAANLLSGVSVRSERNSGTDYIASLDFSFLKDGVRQTLNGANVPFVDIQAEPTTVITALRQGNPPTTVNDKSLWRRAWSSLDLTHSVTPVTLADLTPQIHNDTVDMVLSGDDNGLRILTNEYRTDRVVLAVAEPDASAGKLLVTLAGRDAVGPFLLKRTYRIPQGDLAYASELAAVVSLGILEGRWKEQNTSHVTAAIAGGAAVGQPAWAASPATGGEAISFAVHYASSAQWDEIRAQLLNTPGVDGVSITSFSDTEARVSLNYPGGPRNLANALGARGLYLRDVGQGLVLSTNY